VKLLRTPSVTAGLAQAEFLRELRRNPPIPGTLPSPPLRFFRPQFARDQQLERAVAEVVKQLRLHPPRKVKRRPYPRRPGV